MRTIEELNTLINELEGDLERLPFAGEKWCHKRGDLAKAQYQLFGILEHTDPNRAVRLLYDAARVGYTLAVLRLQDTKPSKDSSKPVSEMEFQRLIQGLSPEQVFERGLQAHSGVGTKLNPALAFQYFEAGAKQGHPPSQNFLGWKYRNGGKDRWPKSPDYTNAAKWFESAAAKGCPLATSNIGSMYLSGQISDNDSKALVHFCFGAEKGDGYAQHNLGKMYDEGLGVAQDYVMAAHFYRLSAYQGSDKAQVSLDGLGKKLQKEIKKYKDDNISDAKKFISDLANQSDVLIKAQLQERAKFGSVNVFTAIAEEWLNTSSSEEIKNSRIAFVKKLIDHPAEGSESLLHVARAQKKLELFLFTPNADHLPKNWELVFKLIDQFGADPNVPSNDENSQYPLLICYAAAFEEKHILEKLMKRGGNYEGILDKESALMAAICEGKTENIDLLLENGFSCSEVLLRSNHPKFLKKLSDTLSSGFIQFPAHYYTEVSSQAEGAHQIEYSCIPHEFAQQIKETNYFSKKSSIINSLISILKRMDNPERDRIKNEFKIPDRLLENDTQVKPSPEYDPLFGISIHKWEAQLSLVREKLSVINRERIRKADEEAKAALAARKSQKKAMGLALGNLQKMTAELNLIRIPDGVELSPQIIISIIELAACLDTEVSALKMLEGKLPSFTISDRKIKEYDSVRLIELQKRISEIENSLKSEIAVLSVTEADASEIWTREEKRLWSLIQQLEEKIASSAFQFDDPSAEVWCEMRGQLAELQYHLFCLLETKMPLEAVRLLWASFEIGYQPARARLFERESEASDSLLPGVLDALTENELFERGLQVLSGAGVTSNHCQAYEYFEAAALRGHATSQYLIGRVYDLACWGRKQDFDKAHLYYKMAIENGETLAESNLGVMVEKGRGVEKNSAEAFKLYLASAKKGSSAALYNLGISYKEGVLGLEPNHRLAAKCFRLASKQGNAFGLFALGKEYIAAEGVEQNEKEALKCFLKASELGNANAQAQLGVIYIEGKWVEQDYIRALLYLGQLADKSCLRPAFNLAVMYLKGWGLKLDLAMADYLLRKVSDEARRSETGDDQEVLREAAKRLEAISAVDLARTIEEYKEDNLSEYLVQSSREPKKSNYEIEAQLDLRAKYSPWIFTHIAEEWLDSSSSEKERKARESFVKEKAQHLLAHTKIDKALEAKLIDNFGAKPQMGKEKEEHVQALEKALDELNVAIEQFNLKRQGDLKGIKPTLENIAGPLQDLVDFLTLKKDSSQGVTNAICAGTSPLIKIEALRSQIFSVEINKLREFTELARGAKDAIAKESKEFLVQKANPPKPKVAPVPSKPVVAESAQSLFSQDFSYLFNDSSTQEVNKPAQPVTQAPDKKAEFAKPQVDLQENVTNKRPETILQEASTSTEPVIASQANASENRNTVHPAPISIIQAPQKPTQTASILGSPTSENPAPVAAILSARELYREPNDTEFAAAEVSIKVGLSGNQADEAPILTSSVQQNPLQEAVISNIPELSEVNLLVSSFQVPSDSGFISDEVSAKGGIVGNSAPTLSSSTQIPVQTPAISIIQESSETGPASYFQEPVHLKPALLENPTDGKKPQNNLQNLEDRKPDEAPFDWSKVLPSLESLDETAVGAPQNNFQNSEHGKPASAGAPDDFTSILPSLESLDPAAGEKPQQNLPNQGHKKSASEGLIPGVTSEPDSPQKPSKLTRHVKRKKQKNKEQQVSVSDWLALVEQEHKSLITLMDYCEYPNEGLRELVAFIKDEAKKNNQNAKFLEESYKQLRALHFYIELKRTYEFFVLAAENTYANYPSFAAASNSAPEEGNDEIKSTLEFIKLKSMTIDETRLENIMLKSRLMIFNAGFVHTSIELHNKKSSEPSPKDLRKQKLLEEQLKNPPKNPISKMFTFLSNLWYGIKPDTVKYKEGPAFRLEGAPINTHMLEVSKNLLNKLSPLNQLIQDNLNLPKFELKPESELKSEKNSQVKTKNSKPKMASTASSEASKLAQTQVEALSRIVPVQSKVSVSEIARIGEQFLELQKLRDSINALQLSKALQKSPHFFLLKKRVPIFLQQLGLKKGARLELKGNPSIENPSQLLDQLHEAILAARDLLRFAYYQKLYTKLEAFGWPAQDEILSLENNASFKALNTIFDQWEFPSTDAPTIKTAEARVACEELIPLLEKACQRASHKVSVLALHNSWKGIARMPEGPPRGLPDQQRPNAGETAWRPTGKNY